MGLAINNNVTGINKRLGIYRYYHKRVQAKDILPNGKEVILDRVMIMLEKNLNGVKQSVVHPVSEFLHQPIRKGGIPDIKTQNQVANYIVNFLNFVLIENYPTYKISNIKDILFEHGDDYLNVYGQIGRDDAPVKKSTVKRCELYLTRFYFFLAKKKLLKHITVNDFEYREFTYEDLSKYKLPESPFNNVEYPADNEQDIKVIHNIPKELIIQFILTAFSYTPRIALGVAFQCFGGLRVGEVVNISRTGLTPSGEFGKYGFQVKITNRLFRGDLKDITGQGTPKKIRRQGIFPFNGDVLQMLYKAHIENYKATDGSNALFVNKNGKAMAKFTYQNEFKKLKEKFIALLIESDDLLLKTYGLELSSARWSTHICRGIFSNLIAEDASNVLQVMSARGDSSPLSSLTYLNNTDTMLDILKGNYDEMYANLLAEKEEPQSNLSGN